MKFSTIFSVIVIFGYFRLSSTMSMIEPISSVLQIKYNLPVMDWETKCHEAYKEIEELKIQAGQLSLFQLPSLISGKLTNSQSIDGLDDLIKQDCSNNPELKNISQKVVSGVQTCLDKDNKLDAAKEEEMDKALMNVLCGNVKRTIEWNIQSLKFAQKATE